MSECFLIVNHIIKIIIWDCNDTHGGNVLKEKPTVTCRFWYKTTPLVWGFKNCSPYPSCRSILLKRQWNELGGKCGTCGDPYDAEVPENEAGGKYATGIIGRNYTRGQIIKVRRNYRYFNWRISETKISRVTLLDILYLTAIFTSLWFLHVIRTHEALTSED